MKTSLSIWSVHKFLYDGTWDNADFIDFVGTTRASGVELLSVFWGNKDKEIPLVQAALERNNLEVACFGACNNLAVSDMEKRKEQIKDITDSVDMAKLLGAKVVRVFSGDKEKDVTYEQAKTWIIDGLKEASEYAGCKGITLCLENHGYFAGKYDQVIEIINEVQSPALRSTFDTGNFLLVDQDPNEAVAQLKKYVAHVHFKDFILVDEDFQGTTYTSNAGKRYSGRVPGEGIVDLQNILTQLRDVNYDGWLTVEYEGDEEQKLGSTRSLENLDNILKTL